MSRFVLAIAGVSCEYQFDLCNPKRVGEPEK